MLIINNVNYKNVNISKTIDLNNFEVATFILFSYFPLDRSL